MTTGALFASRSLAARNLLLLRRNPQSIVSAIVAPLVFFAGFMAVMNKIMEARGIDYAQFLPPAIVVQAMFFTAIASGFVLAADAQSGLVRRFRSLPIPGATVLAARAMADAVRAILSLVVVVAAAMVVGFRFEAGVASALGFVVLAVGFAAVVAAGCGAVGLAKADPESTQAVLMLPYLALLMLSTAFVPVSSFPSWLQPLVSRSPVSAVIDALRALSSGGDLAGPLATSIGWLVVLGVAFLWSGNRALRSQR